LTLQARLLVNPFPGTGSQAAMCENKAIREVRLPMGLIEAKKVNEILDIRRLTEGGFVEGVSAGG
jgi:hypothetical protein